LFTGMMEMRCCPGPIDFVPEEILAAMVVRLILLVRVSFRRTPYLTKASWPLPSPLICRTN
jgi:hypothetical protein